MTPMALLQALEQLGVVLTLHPDGTLRCKAPKGVLTHVMQADMRQHKAVLVDLLKERLEREAITGEVRARPETPRRTVPPALPPVPCLVHDAIFFERQGEGLICWKCIVLASRSV